MIIFYRWYKNVINHLKIPKKKKTGTERPTPGELQVAIFVIGVLTSAIRFVRLRHRHLSTHLRASDSTSRDHYCFDVLNEYIFFVRFSFFLVVICAIWMGNIFIGFLLIYHCDEFWWNKIDKDCYFCFISMIYIIVIINTFEWQFDIT